MRKSLVLFMFLSLITLSGCTVFPFDFASTTTTSNWSQERQALLRSINALSEEARHSNIYIKTTLVQSMFGGVFERTSGGQGSGFVFKHEDGAYYALTNFHVIDKKNATRVEYEITLHDGTVIDNGEVIASGNARLDLAIIRFETDAELPLTKIDPDVTINIGDFILVIGNPGGLQNVVTTSEITNFARIRNIDYDVFMFKYTMDASGNSGGAIINLDGDLIGIITWQSRIDDDHKFGIPIEQIHAFLVQHGMMEEEVE